VKDDSNQSNPRAHPAHHQWIATSVNASETKWYEPECHCIRPAPAVLSVRERPLDPATMQSHACTRITALDEGSTSDRPSYYAHARWTPPLLLASAEPHQTRRCYSSLLMTSQWKPTTTAVNQYSFMGHCSRYSCSTFVLDLWSWLLISGELWSWPTHVQNIKVIGQLVQKLERKQMTGGPDWLHYLPH